VEGYEIGQTPPELEEDGTFQTPLGVRASSIVDGVGRILSVDKDTKCLVEDNSDDE
jgi:hypothetical protein